MKITIYELLGLVKDGKAPKEIKYKERVWKYKEEFEDYYNGMWSLLENQIDVISKYFDDVVEIVEKDKEIEEIKELDLELDGKSPNYNVCEQDLTIQNKINELVRELNKLKKRE